jgi:hypothetical protein
LEDTVENDVFPPEETTEVEEPKPPKKTGLTIAIVLFLCLGCIVGTVAGWYLGDYVIGWISSF